MHTINAKGLHYLIEQYKRLLNGYNYSQLVPIEDINILENKYNAGSTPTLELSRAITKSKQTEHITLDDYHFENVDTL